MFYSAGKPDSGGFPLAFVVQQNAVAEVRHHRKRRLRGLPVQISVGRGDLFYRIDREYAAALRAEGVHPEWHTGTGAHSQRFWRTFVPGLLQFTGRHLSA